MDKPSPYKPRSQKFFFFFKIYIPHQKHMNFSFHPESHYFLCNHWHSRNQLLKHGFFYLLFLLRK